MTTKAASEQAREKAHEHPSSTMKSLFGSKKGAEEKKDGSDDGSVASTSSTTNNKKATNWLGKEVKRPRAEYQAEIDELKLKIAGLEADFERTTIELQQFKDWVGMAPSAF